MTDPKGPYSSGSGRVLTPMEEEYPTLCAWTRHQGVSVPALRAELEKALAWIKEGDGEPCDCGNCDANGCGFVSATARVPSDKGSGS